MKTLNTLLALALLVSSVAPVCAMDGKEETPVTSAETTPVASPREATPDVAAPDVAAPVAGVQSEGFLTKAKAFADEKVAAVKGFYAYNSDAKLVSFAKYGVTAAAVAAVVGGFVYLFTGEEDEDVTEEAPVSVEPQVQTVVEAPVITPAPVAKAKAPVRKPRLGKTRFGKTSRVKRGGCRTGGCR